MTLTVIRGTNHFESQHTGRSKLSTLMQNALERKIYETPLR